MEYCTARTKNRHLTHLTFVKEAGPKGDTLCDSLNGEFETGQNQCMAGNVRVGVGSGGAQGDIPERRNVLGLGLVSGRTGVCVMRPSFSCTCMRDTLPNCE